MSVFATSDSGRINVAWTASDFDGGSPITEYEVQSTPAGYGCMSNDSLSCEILGLEPGVRYRFQVVAKTAIGSSTTSPASNLESLLTPPSPPRSVSASAGDRTALVIWSQPNSDGGRQVLSYTAVSQPGGFTCETTEATACEIRGLHNGTPYAFTVSARNALGTSDLSNPSELVVPTSPGLIISTTQQIVSVGDEVALTLSNLEEGASVKCKFPGASTQLMAVDDSGTATCTFMITKSKTSAITASSGRNTVTSIFYSPGINAPKYVRKGKPATFTITGAPIGADVAVLLNGESVCNEAASAKGSVTLSIESLATGDYDYEIKVLEQTISAGSFRVG
jgi:hypothetical protein